MKFGLTGGGCEHLHVVTSFETEEDEGKGRFTKGQSLQPKPCSHFAWRSIVPRTHAE